MNWYKKSMPIYKNIEFLDSRMRYDNILHDIENQDIDIWVMDDNYNVHMKLAKNDDDVHGNWDKYNDLLVEKKILAWGRWSSGENLCTLAISERVMNLRNPLQREYLTKKIEKVLDYEFNNPTIINFLPGRFLN
jgi:Fe-S cluster biosynthesis and repair protein YggX